MAVPSRKQRELTREALQLIANQQANKNDHSTRGDRLFGVRQERLREVSRRIRRIDARPIPTDAQILNRERFAKALKYHSLRGELVDGKLPPGIKLAMYDNIQLDTPFPRPATRRRVYKAAPVVPFPVYFPAPPMPVPAAPRPPPPSKIPMLVRAPFVPVPAYNPPRSQTMIPVRVPPRSRTYLQSKNKTKTR